MAHKATDAHYQISPTMAHVRANKRPLHRCFALPQYPTHRTWFMSKVKWKAHQSSDVNLINHAMSDNGGRELDAATNRPSSSFWLGPCSSVTFCIGENCNSAYLGNAHLFQASFVWSCVPGERCLSASKHSMTCTAQSKYKALHANVFVSYIPCIFLRKVSASTGPYPRGGRTGRTIPPPNSAKVHFFRLLILQLFQNFRRQATNSPGESSLVQISSQTTNPRSELGTGLQQERPCLHQHPNLFRHYFMFVHKLWTNQSHLGICQLRFSFKYGDLFLTYVQPERRGSQNLDIKLSANEETLCHGETSHDVRQASLCTRPMAEQIWVLVQARYHLLAETLRRKMHPVQQKPLQCGC